jgi:hypothetical protein
MTTPYRAGRAALAFKSWTLLLKSWLMGIIVVGSPFAVRAGRRAHDSPRRAKLIDFRDGRIRLHRSETFI